MLRRCTRESLKATGIHDMARANTISHVDLPTGPMESANVGRVPSGVPGNPLYGHEWHSGSQGKPSSLTVVSMPSFPRKRESTSIRKTSEFSIFTEMASFRGARTRLDLENEGSLVYAIWDTDDPPDADRESLTHLYHPVTQYHVTSDSYDVQNRRVALQLHTQGPFRRWFYGSLPEWNRCPKPCRWPAGVVRHGWLCARATLRRRRGGRWR